MKNLFEELEGKEEENGKRGERKYSVKKKMR